MVSPSIYDGSIVMAEFFETSEFIIVKDRCSHCSGKGFCSTNNGYSCEKCHYYNSSTRAGYRDEKGLPCSVCEGSGWVTKKVKK